MLYNGNALCLNKVCCKLDKNVYKFFSQNTSPVSVKNPRNLIIDTKITKIGQKDT